MKLVLLCIGKTAEVYLQDGISEYEKRLKRYGSFEIIVCNDVKNAQSLPKETLKTREGEIFLQNVKDDDCVVLLDDKGKMLTSVQFADYLQKNMNSGVKRLVFIIGGAFGFSSEMYSRANNKLSLSAMTFSHQMVRLIALEQLYRAKTILANEPYHHE